MLTAAPGAALMASLDPVPASPRAAARAASRAASAARTRCPATDTADSATPSKIISTGRAAANSAVTIPASRHVRPLPPRRGRKRPVPEICRERLSRSCLSRRSGRGCPPLLDRMQRRLDDRAQRRLHRAATHDLVQHRCESDSGNGADRILGCRHTAIERAADCLHPPGDSFDQSHVGKPSESARRVLPADAICGRCVRSWTTSLTNRPSRSTPRWAAGVSAYGGSRRPGLRLVTRLLAVPRDAAGMTRTEGVRA